MHPHCEHCEAEKLRLFDLQREENEQNNRCSSCETLETTNNALIRENSRLVEALIDKNKNVPEPVREEQDLKPLRTTHVPWNVRRQMKEAESRTALRNLQDAAQANKPKSTSTTQPTGIVKDDELAEIERELADVSTGKEETTKSA